MWKTMFRIITIGLFTETINLYLDDYFAQQILGF